MSSRRVLKIGGVISGGVLIAFGIVVIVLAINGRNTVHDELKQQQITGTPDMTPARSRRKPQRPGSRTSAIPPARLPASRWIRATRRAASRNT
jgi:hypothetical protein